MTSQYSLLNGTQIVREPRDHLLGGPLRIGLFRILHVELETPYGHLPRTMRRKGLATIDDALDLLLRKHAALATGDAREIRHDDVEACRNHSVTLALVAVAARAEALIKLRARVAGEVLGARGDGGQDEQNHEKDERDRNVPGVRFHGDLLFG